MFNRVSIYAEQTVVTPIIWKTDSRSCVVFQAIISNYQDLMPPEFENYFCYAAMWAFGGTLVEEHRPYFSQWWKEKWNDFVLLPGDEEVRNQSNYKGLTSSIVISFVRF